MGRTIAGAFTLALGSAVAFVWGHPWIGTMAGLCSVCIVAALVADAIWGPKRLVVTEGFSCRLKEDTRIEAHAGAWVTIHPAREVPREDVRDILKGIGRAPVYLDEKKMSAQELKELHDRITRKGD